MTKKIDILFIHSNNSSKTYQDLSKEYSAIEPPIWAGMLAQACRVKGYESEIMDCENLRLSHLESLSFIEWKKPQFICFVVYGQQPSASTQNMEGATRLAEYIKKNNPSLKIIFVGPHMAALPFKTLRDHPFIDYVCENEGVHTILDLLSGKDPYEVPGLLFKEDTGVILTKPAGIVSQKKMQEDLPGVAWDMLPMNNYRTSLWHSFTNDCDQGNFASIYTSLGCPYSCSFCMINVPFGNQKFRYWDPKFTIEQLKKLSDLGVVNLKIADEMFVFNPEHFMEICKGIIKEGLKFNIWCYARIDTIKKEYMETMKGAGINWIGLGIESGSKKVRRNVIKGTFDELDIQKVVRGIDSFGINVAANYIFGLPEDTLESMESTFALALDLNTPMANFYSCMAYPGSQLYRNTIVENSMDLPETYSGYSQHSYDCRPLRNKNLTAEQILTFRDEAWAQYHDREEYFDLLLKKFGIQAVLKTKEMIEIELKRKILGD